VVIAQPSDRAQHALLDAVDPGWAEALAPVASDLAAMADFLRRETVAGRRYLPADEHIMRAFAQPFDDVRIAIVGHDPYPTPGHSVGLAFSVDRGVSPLPHSLENIYAELRADLGVATPEHGDLTAWTHRGVLLMNRCLTVAPDRPASHRGRGWKAVTDQAMRALAARRRPLVAVLFGSDSRRLQPVLADAACVPCGHPSVRSANRGFFGSRPFSRANALLVEQGADPVDWSLGTSAQIKSVHAPGVTGEMPNVR
jgi:uracil-DNA glycosylase